MTEPAQCDHIVGLRRDGREAWLIEQSDPDGPPDLDDIAFTFCPKCGQRLTPSGEVAAR